jgi:hypothetical protein
MDANRASGRVEGQQKYCFLAKPAGELGGKFLEMGEIGGKPIVLTPNPIWK